MNDEIELDNVLTMKPIRKGDLTEPPARRKVYRRPCEHSHVVLDVDNRSVECRTCGAVVDAFDALLNISGDWERVASWVKRAREEKRELIESIDDLKRQRRNLDAQVQRRKRKVTP